MMVRMMLMGNNVNDEDDRGVDGGVVNVVWTLSTEEAVELG